MEAVPRLSMIFCDLKVSPSNTEFGPVLKKYIRDHYHEDPESYSKEIKELETLRQNAIKAPMDFTGCSILKKYYSQLQKLQSRFPMTDDGAACVPFMWTDIYSGVAYNITDIEYEQACILYNIGALHSKLGTMDSRINAEGIKIACTHFQCAAFAFQHLRDTYPQPKGSDMSHDLLTFFINVMLAQAQECILEKSMLDNRKSSITAKIAAQVVDYYKCALGIMVSGSPSTDTGSILDIVGSKIYKGWKKFIEFKMAYYTSISHLYMGNQAEENEKWGERVAWFQSAFDHLTEAFKIAKKIDREDLNEALTFTNDVIGGKHNSSKKENDFVYHDKVPALSSLPELKGASLVKGIPFSPSDPDVSGPDIFARLVPMEAHETSSLYSEEKAKILRSVVTKIEGKNEELMAYLSSLQLETATSFDDEDKVPQELIEKCAAISVRPTAISDLTSMMNELFEVSKDVEASLKMSIALLTEEDQKEVKHQETFGKRGPSMITGELKKECSKYEEAHKKAVESNSTLQTAVSIHIGNLSKLSTPLDQIIEGLPSACSIKTPENVKIMDEFNHLVNKVEEMRKQREFLENQLRDALMKDDITKRLVTLNKKDAIQSTFAEELKKHNETLTYLDQNLTAQDNILCALTESNARYADTRKALSEIRLKREEMINTLINSFDAYEDLMETAKKGLEFYKKLQCNVTRLLSRIKSVTKVQDEERAQRTEAELRKGGRVLGLPTVSHEQQHIPKLKDYLPYLNKRGGGVVASPAMPFNMNPNLQSNVASAPSPYLPESMRQATLGGPCPESFDRSLKPSPSDSTRPDDNFDVSSMGIRPTPVGSEQTSVPAMCTAALSNVGVGHLNPYAQIHQPWSAAAPVQNNNGSQVSLQHATQNVMHQPANNYEASAPASNISSTYTSTVPSTLTNSYNNQNYSYPSNTCASSVQNLSSYPSYQTSVNNPGVQPSFLPSVIPTGMGPLGSTTEQKPEARALYPSNSVHIPSSVVPTGVAYPTNSFPQRSFYSSASVLPSNSMHAANPGVVHSSVNSPGSAMQPNLSHSLSSAHQSSYVAPSKSLPSSIHSSSVQPPNSAQFPVSSVYPSSINNPALQSPAVSSISQSSVSSFDRNIVKTGNISAVTNIPNSSATMHGASYNLPYSLNQQNSFASSGIVQQNQEFPTWQTNAMYTTNYMPPNTVQPTTYNAGVTPNVQYNPSISSMQYYHGSGVPVQAKQACVTAAMDTKTNTLNSLNPYAVANSNVGHYLEQNVNGHTPNSIRTSNMSNPGSLQMQASSDVQIINKPLSNIPGMPIENIIPPNCVCSYTSPSENASIYNSVPSSLSYACNSSAYGYNNSLYAPNQNTYVNNVPAADTIQNGSISQNHTAYSSPVNMQSNPCVIPSQQSQISVCRGDNLSCINAAYGSSPNISNQQLPTPIEPKPLSSTQSTQNFVACNQSSQSPVIEPLPKSSSADLQTNVLRDFITPPPDPVVDSETEKVKEITPVLQPKVIDLKAIAELKEKDSSHLAKDPLDDPSVCAKFVSEVEKYEKFVDGLVRKSLNGTTPLDQKWKEFLDVQDKESRKMSISVARCCPLKNRFPDVMPYDNNRVKLTSAKDDYINASYLKDICPNSPVFVITQAPLPSTFNDFWLMVWEQQVETLICLLSDIELKNHVYYPKERGQILTYGLYDISLHSLKEKNGFVERMINVTHTKNRTSRVVVHLQFTEWPVSGVPNSPATMLQFITDSLSYYKQQRNLMRPIVVHCSAGIGRSGCFCIIAAMVSEMNIGHGPRDVTQVVASVSYQRKFLIQDKDHLKFCYDTVLYYAQDLLMRRGILTTRASFDDKLPGTTNTSSHVRHPSEDFILGGGLAKLQSGIAKLGLSSDSTETKGSEPESKATIQDTLITETPVSFVSGDVKQDFVASKSEPEETVQLETELIDSTELSKNRKGSADKQVSSITSLLDPLNFTLDAKSSPAKHKITKENFAASKGSLSTSSSDSADPLSQLDPLWSLKK